MGNFVVWISSMQKLVVCGTALGNLVKLVGYMVLHGRNMEQSPGHAMAHPPN